MNRLEAVLGRLIAEEGPLPIDRYMGLCLGHPQFGYYMTRDPLGEKGDFLTAPEVSQVFGELIGVWCAAVWASMGRPRHINLVELGPGRGTLMADVRRAIGQTAPALAQALSIHLVETSPVLRAAQRERLDGVVEWHASLADVPDGPMLCLANEFFDAIPVRQIERRGGRWHERVVGLTDSGLTLGLGLEVEQPGGEEGDVAELSPAREEIARSLGRRLAGHGGAALIIDYGHLGAGPGDTLQAMRGHRFVPVTHAPGESDLTAHVDFAALGRALAAGGAVVRPALTQRQFLLAMGLETRFSRLAAGADAAAAAQLARQQARLAEEAQMGNLFKVLAATMPTLPTPYPFGP
ncbi:class I SAM-dependent methyltransferase [Aestuariivirga sp.]|uniref:class I SAM-dependent methyltransferase n=1 Tax=Aestuariivirga sp. TaxID=2650926 RepID=UPI0037851EB7